MKAFLNAAALRSLRWLGIAMLAMLELPSLLSAAITKLLEATRLACSNGERSAAGAVSVLSSVAQA